MATEDLAALLAAEGSGKAGTSEDKNGGDAGADSEDVDAAMPRWGSFPCRGAVLAAAVLVALLGLGLDGNVSAFLP